MKNILLKHHIWFFCLLLIASSCQKETDNPDVRDAETIMNVSYGNDALHKMDVYLPAGRTQDSTRVMVLIHEGAWSDGDKAGFNSYIPLLQQRLPGYAIFNINYRLVNNGNNIFPTQENDVKAALEFIYSKRAEYAISDKFALLGASAGGHLALLQGYKYNTPVKPKAIASFFGPVDLIHLYNSNPLAGLLLSGVTGTTPTANAAFYEQSSPITFVNATSPPTILLHGGADPIVPPAQADSLKARLVQAGVPHQHVFYPAEGHGWDGAELNDSMDKIATFLKQHVN
jgi:acetyl esterase/lipase